MSARAETESRSACIDFLNRAAADRRGVFYVREAGSCSAGRDTGRPLGKGHEVPGGAHAGIFRDLTDWLFGRLWWLKFLADINGRKICNTN